MNLRKMGTLIGMALALVIFAAPAAQAAPPHGLTEGGIMLEEGAPVTLTSTNLKTETGLGTLTCAKVTLHYHVETNNEEHLALAPTPAATKNATTENCKLNGTTTVHISDAGTHTVTMDTWGHAEVESSFKGVITSIFGPITCTYTGKVTIQATTTTDTVHVGPSSLASGCGAGTMSGTFTAETPDGTPLEGHIEPTG